MINRVVVRVTSSMYSNSKSFHYKRSCNLLKRKSLNGYWVLNEECDLDHHPLENLLEVEDGVYQVVVSDEHRDWESGMVDDYTLKLIPYEGVDVL